jgi:hypothetical protein
MTEAIDIHCPSCNENREHVDVVHPLLLHLIVPTSFLGMFSTDITILGKEYNHVSVEYGNMSHYKCRFLRGNKVYEYDGMNEDRGYSLVTSKPSFPPMLQYMYRASGAWFKRVD